MCVCVQLVGAPTVAWVSKALVFEKPNAATATTDSDAQANVEAAGVSEADVTAKTIAALN